jgi:hypothetical protein
MRYTLVHQLVDHPAPKSCKSYANTHVPLNEYNNQQQAELMENVPETYASLRCRFFTADFSIQRHYDPDVT